ncbi:MAG: hypothetical protein LC799_17475, partial [Actinobacteria bacterium]|nr:hypothetical protein [Actinomycetota bacterium]
MASPATPLPDPAPPPPDPRAIRMLLLLDVLVALRTAPPGTPPSTDLEPQHAQHMHLTLVLQHEVEHLAR